MPEPDSTTSTSYNDVNSEPSFFKSGQTLQYPLEDSTHVDNWLVITEYKYSRPSRNSDAKPEPTNNVFELAVPNNISADYGANWGEVEMGFLGDKVIRGAGNMIRNGGLNTSDLSSAVLSNMQSLFNAEGRKNMFQKGSEIISGVVTDAVLDSSAGQKLSTELGVTRNPLLAATFNGVGFRTFKFDFKMIARSRAESTAINNIYRKFKYGMHPSYNERFSTNLFDYPFIYTIDFVSALGNAEDGMLSSSANKYLFSIGYCALKDLSYNPHAEGSPIYFDNDDGTVPMSIDLGLSFQEIEIVTKETIESLNR